MVSTQAGKLEDAVRDYASALELANQAGDTETAEAARKNLSLLFQERQKQKQQQEQESKEGEEGKEGKEGKDGKEGGDKKNDPNGKGDSEKDNKDRQDQTGKQQDRVEDSSKSRERKQREFDSRKMTREDAQKVMAELSSREKELQRRLKKQKGGGQPGGKDW